MRPISVLVPLALVGVSHAFVAPRSPVERSTTSLFVDIPRVDLPSVITDKMEEMDLNNPNSMTTEEYNNYSGSAILGTLLFFVLPGALVTGLPGEAAAVLGSITTDFVISALVGGGGAIYASLQDDDLGSTVRGVGYNFLSTGKSLTGLKVSRYAIPEAATDAMTESLGLMNPNEMNEQDYDGYSGAAIAGTLLSFLLPGAFLTGAADNAKGFLSAATTDFLLSAIVGGGAFIYLSLRDDDLSVSVNRAGAKLLDTVDQLLDGSYETLPESKSIPIPTTAAATKPAPVEEKKE